MSIEVLLQGINLTHRFGGLMALNEVSIALRQGEVHAVIGTNGAGKSTLINLLSGEFEPSSGRVQLMGKDVSNWTQAQRARSGLGRSYQRNTIFANFSVLENCRLCAQAQHQQALALWRNATRDKTTLSIAQSVAARVGLGEVLDRQAGLLSHGQKRQLEIAMCLAISPKVILLDEPLAGMGAEETERMLVLLNELKSDHALLLVEHDMDAVFRIADQITVMVNGTVIASGSPDEVKNNAEVKSAYLGDH